MIEINETVIGDLTQGFNLPPKPELLSQLQQVLQQEAPELHHIAQIIADDVATSAAVLKVINSPFYGMSRTVTDIKQAVMFLGLDSITSLVTGFLLQQAFKQSLCCIKLERFWDTASEIANVATMIGKKLKSKVPSENLHMIGLFHDAGIPAMAMNYSDYINVLSAANHDSEHTLIEHEESHYRTNHAVVGYFIATSWHLPKHICQLILRHHDRDFIAGDEHTIDDLTFATLKIAENIVHQQKRFIPDPDWAFVKSSVLSALHLDEEDYLDIKEDAQEYFDNLA